MYPGESKYKSKGLDRTNTRKKNNRGLGFIKSLHMQLLRKHAYSNILKILPPKHENFQIKNTDIFLISAQNIDCGYSLEYPQSMFLSRNKKIMYTPVNPSFTV